MVRIEPENGGLAAPEPDNEFWGSGPWDETKQGSGPCNVLVGLRVASCREFAADGRTGLEGRKVPDSRTQFDGGWFHE